MKLFRFFGQAAVQYIVDPQLIVDMLENDPQWGKPSTELMNAHKGEVLLLAPISYLALGLAFRGTRTMQDEFLSDLGITVIQHIPIKIMHAAYGAWCKYQKENPGVGGGGNVFDALYIGACALNYDGILTRQGELFRACYPQINAVEPERVA